MRTLLRRIPGLNRIIPHRPVVPVVRLHGTISPSGSPLRPALNIASVAGLLEQAFSMGGISAVALSVNSPGGSPVQSALIHDRIRMLAEEKKLPVHVFCEDVAASGGYWIACAGDEIHANENSILGSIGVIAATFGFEALIARLGVERRVYTAGEKKSFLDPFKPAREEDVQRLLALQQEMHESFKGHVRRRRGVRLKGEESELFSGEFWTGAGALELGLIDSIGDLRTVLRQRYGEKVLTPVIESQKGWLKRRLGLSADLSGLSADATIEALENRALWARYGL